MTPFIAAILCCVLVAASGQDTFQLSYIAEQMDQYCGLRSGSTQSPHGPSATAVPRVGKSGPRGPPGPRGPAGSMDYSRVRGIVEEIIESKLAALREEITSLGQTSSRPAHINPEHCRVQYNGKCFWAITEGHDSVEAGALCRRHGAELANIYDETHFEKMRVYLATVARNDWDDYFTGMTYNPSTEVVSRRDGTRSPFMHWLSSAPYSGSDTTVIMFDSHNQASKAGLWNVRPGSTQEGALCEI